MSTEITMRTAAGFTLIEMMISILLGLFLTGAVIHVTIVSNRNFNQDEMVARMQENARFALRELVRDVSMTEFWGETLDPDDVNPNGMSADIDCDADTTDSWPYETDPSLEFMVGASVSTATSTFPCIANGEFKPDTDVLAIKRLAGNPKLRPHGDDDTDDGTAFFRACDQGGILILFDPDDLTCPSPPAPTEIIDWQYLVHIYYVMPDSSYAADPDCPVTETGDGVPTLYRKTLQQNAMKTECGGIAQGIEYFHIQYGIDGNSNGIPDYYVSSPSATELGQAVTARIWVLARALQPDTTYVNENVYVLGDVTWDVAARNGGDGDHFRRLLVSTTTKMPNPANRQLLDL